MGRRRRAWDIRGTANGGRRRASPASGRFARGESRFRHWITPDGAPGPSGTGGFRAESGRYHPYVSLACPWAHRALIFCALKGLAPHVGVDVVRPLMLDDGWTFSSGFPGATGDSLHGARFLRDTYTRAEPTATGEVTVPVLWDKDRETLGPAMDWTAPTRR